MSRAIGERPAARGAAMTRSSPAGTSRRTLLAWLAAASFGPAAPPGTALAQQTPRRTIEARIERRRVVAPKASIRVSEGDAVELRWTSDEPVELHLHGYDVTIEVRPDKPAAMVFRAHASGRFPITSHGWGDGGHGHGHDALIYFEVYPK